MVQYQQYGTVPTVWYTTNSMVQYQQYGTVPTVWYTTNSMVQYQQYGTVPTIWYSTSGMVQYQQMCDTDVKYNIEPSKTGVPKNAPVGSWRAGMLHLPPPLEEDQFYT